MLIGDFNIDFKNKKDSNLEKLNNFYDTFSLTNLQPWTEYLRKTLLSFTKLKSLISRVFQEFFF